MISTNQIKKWIKRVMPAPLLDGIQSARIQRAKPNPLVTQARERFEELNRTVPAGQIAMRPGMVWNIDPESRDPFTWFCYQSVNMVEEFDLFLQKSVGKKRFLDLGANHGVYSLAFTCNRPEASAVALDPSPLAFPILQNNLRLNPQCRVTALQVAAGAAAGHLRMKIFWHHLEVIADQNAEESDQVKIVPVRTVDSICEELGFEPDLMKVDVEGHELAALQGMEKILRRLRPEFGLEIHPVSIEPLDYRVNDIIDYLYGLNYEFYSLQGVELSREWLNDQIHVFWVFCRPRDHQSAPQ